jgi:hypothetical protein
MHVDAVILERVAHTEPTTARVFPFHPIREGGIRGFGWPGVERGENGEEQSCQDEKKEVGPATLRELFDVH